MDSDSIKPLIETFKEKMKEEIDQEEDEKRREILIEALNRGIALLEGR